MMWLKHVCKLAIDRKERDGDPQSVFVERFLASAGTGGRKSFQGTGSRVAFRGLS